MRISDWSSDVCSSVLWLVRVERLVNALPDPVFICLGLSAALGGVSVAAALRGWSAVNPVSGETLTTQSLLSAENVGKLLTQMPETMAHFPPLRLILVVMLGAAVAERSGLFTALLTRARRGVRSEERRVGKECVST